ncbi:MAG: peptide-methionine (R)-S-oxide reductase [Pseudomonadota bacterium]
MTKHVFNRRALFGAGALTALAGLLPASWTRAASAGTDEEYTYEVTRSDAEWREMLTEEEYRILREGGTEKQKSSPLWNETRDGTYHCKGCDLTLYDGVWKTVLDKGWLFFYVPRSQALMISMDGLGYRYSGDTDVAAATTNEVHCRRCGSHIGHVFNVDGTLLHCVNGTAMNFAAAET